MARTTIDDVKHRRLAGMTTDERAEFDAAYDATRLAIEVGEQICDAASCRDILPWVVGSSPTRRTNIGWEFDLTATGW